MLEILGMDELLKKLDDMHEAPKKAGAKALKKAGEHVRRVEYDIVSKEHNRYWEKVGREELKRYGVKTRRNGSQIIDIGLRGKMTASQKKKDEANKRAGAHRPTHWDRIRGLWFNNWGFYHNITGQYVAGSNWLEKAYDDSSAEAYKIIRAELIKELEL